MNLRKCTTFAGFCNLEERGNQCDGLLQFIHDHNIRSVENERTCAMIVCSPPLGCLQLSQQRRRAIVPLMALARPQVGRLFATTALRRTWKRFYFNNLAPPLLILVGSVMRVYSRLEPLCSSLSPPFSDVAEVEAALRGHRAGR